MDPASMIWHHLAAWAGIVRAHAFIVITILTFLGAGLGTFMVSRANRPGTGLVGGFVRHCFPWVHWKSATVRVDALIYLAAHLTQKWIALLSGLTVVFLAAQASTMLRHVLQIDHVRAAGPVTVAVIAVIMFVFADLGSFLSHLVQHKVPLLWEFHKIHHSATFLTPLTTYRFHPVGNLLDGVFIGLCVAIPVGVVEFAYGLGYAQLLAMSAGTEFLIGAMLLSTLQHSHFPISFGVLDRVFISPRMHQVHHSVKRAHWGKNLGGKLSVWDWCYGSALLLPRTEEIRFGMGTIEDERGDYASILWCYVGPIVGCFTVIRKYLSRGTANPAADTARATGYPTPQLQDQAASARSLSG